MSRSVPDNLSPADRERLRKAPQPDWTSPMLATLTDERFSRRDWIFERKLDGERALAFRRKNGVDLLTRNRKAIGDSYPELASALAEQEGRFVVDGEIVAFDGRLTSFSRLQGRMQIDDPDEAKATGIAVYYYLFDILYLDGYRLEKLPLRSRKKLLRRALDFDDPVRYCQHRNRNGESFFDEACEKGWEGVIAKKATSRYAHQRSRDWLKFKCGNSQELVIGGYTRAQGSREGFGALLVGYYENDELRYAGKVGTGFDDAFLASFRERMDRLQRKSSPFADPPAEDDDVTWVTPKFVGEFAFTEWTRHGKLRHPRFIGLRRDKDPRNVVRER